MRKVTFRNYDTGYSRSFYSKSVSLNADNIGYGTYQIIESHDSLYEFFRDEISMLFYNVMNYIKTFLKCFCGMLAIVGFLTFSDVKYNYGSLGDFQMLCYGFIPAYLALDIMLKTVRYLFSQTNEVAIIITMLKDILHDLLIYCILTYLIFWHATSILTVMLNVILYSGILGVGKTTIICLIKIYKYFTSQVEIPLPSNCPIAIGIGGMAMKKEASNNEENANNKRFN